jgi:hypothetical protein
MLAYEPLSATTLKCGQNYLILRYHLAIVELLQMMTVGSKVRFCL